MTITDNVTNVYSTLLQVKSDYDALPKSSKDSLERIFCVRSTLRIVDEDGLLKAVYALVDAMV